MATEYKCDICGNPATVHITKIIDGKKIKIHLCSACAEKASLEAINLPAEIFPKIQELEKQANSIRKQNMKDFESILTRDQKKILKQMKKEGRQRFEERKKLCPPPCPEKVQPAEASEEK